LLRKASTTGCSHGAQPPTLALQHCRLQDLV